MLCLLKKNKKQKCVVLKPFSNIRNISPINTIDTRKKKTEIKKKIPVKDIIHGPPNKVIAKQNSAINPQKIPKKRYIVTLCLSDTKE